MRTDEFEAGRAPNTDPWWYVWLPRAVTALGWMGFGSLVLWFIAPLVWWLGAEASPGSIEFGGGVLLTFIVGVLFGVFLTERVKGWP